MVPAAAAFCRTRPAAGREPPEHEHRLPPQERERGEETPPGWWPPPAWWAQRARTAPSSPGTGCGSLQRQGSGQRTEVEREALHSGAGHRPLPAGGSRLSLGGIPARAATKQQCAPGMAAPLRLLMLQLYCWVRCAARASELRPRRLPGQHTRTRHDWGWRHRSGGGGGGKLGVTEGPGIGAESD